MHRILLPIALPCTSLIAQTPAVADLTSPAWQLCTRAAVALAAAPAVDAEA